MPKVLRIIDTILTFLENWTLFLAVMVALFSLFVNVVLRYGFHSSLAWSEELVREVIILTTFIGASAAIKRRAMIKIDAVEQIFPSLKYPLAFFGYLVTLCFSVFIFYFGWKMAALQVLTQQKTIILEIPLVYLYAILPVMGVFMFLRTIQVIVEDIQTIRNPSS